MQLTNISQVNSFLQAVEKCIGGVKLKSRYGDVYNLKSKLSQYIAIAALLDSHGNELQLYLDDESDELNFSKFFTKHPELL